MKHKKEKENIKTGCNIFLNAKLCSIKIHNALRELED